MSLLPTHSLAEASAIMRGEMHSLQRTSDFDIPSMAVWRILGLDAAPGHAALNLDEAWEAVVRTFGGLGVTWGLCVAGDESGKASWSLMLPKGNPSAVDSISRNLIGARMANTEEFSQVTARLGRLPCYEALAGHPGMADLARMEAAIRTLLGQDFQLLILARPRTCPEIEEEAQRLASEEQFLRDEYLSRPGLERDNHVPAKRHLALIEAARERATLALQEGGWFVRVLLATRTSDDLRRAQALIQSSYSSGGGKPEPIRWQSAEDPRSLTFLRTAELAALTRLPKRELPGFYMETRIQRLEKGNIVEQVDLFATACQGPLDGESIALGRILDDASQPNQWFEIPIRDLNRHMLVAGMTGSGKSVSCEHLLLELWREHRIPWLVIEPGMKTGYRRLANSEIGGDLDIWAVGFPRSERLPLNPLAAPVGAILAEHTAALFAVFASAFELVAPMPEVLATAIEQTYQRHGWALSDRVPEGPAPLLKDLIEEIDRQTRILGYGPEITGNIRAGLLLRLQRLSNGPLAPEFNSPLGFDAASMVQHPTIIELSALPDAASQALVMGLIALQLRHHWRLTGQSDTLRHVTVIEEAHRLLRSVPETPVNSARNRATEDLANMLAELRGFGAGLVIVDQTPSALVPSVIANTGTKLLHRLDHPEDRELTGRAAGLPGERVDLLGALHSGEAILRSDRRPRPFRLRMPNPSITYSANPLPSLRGDTGVPSVAPCPVCGKVSCAAQSLGGKAELAKIRLPALQDTLPAGEDAVWNWVVGQLVNSGIEKGRPTDPLCFLMALGQACNFSEVILGKLKQAFEPRTRKTRP